MASTTWPTPAAEADRIAAEWEEALQRFGRACERLRGLTPRSATLRWILSPIARRVAAATSDAHRDLWLAKQLVQNAFLGAGRQWGVLSGGHSRAGELRLETTLTELVADYRDVAPVWAQTADQLLAQLPQVRVDAQRGGAAAYASLEARVVDLCLNAPEKEARVRLGQHLPGDRRPLPETLDQLDHIDPPVILSVSVDPWKPQVLRLHDIVVDRDLRGRGLGDATLIHLCRYADARAMAVHATLEPGHAVTEHAGLVRLAAWYARHGFHQEHKPAAEWIRGDPIERAPRSH